MAQILLLVNCQVVPYWRKLVRDFVSGWHVCQGQQKLVDGIGRGTELETDIDPVKARDLLTSPDELLHMRIDFVDEVCRYGWSGSLTLLAKLSAGAAGML